MEITQENTANTVKSKYIRTPLPILIIAFYACSIFTLINWWHDQIYSVNGDEPHYIIMADGITNYHTFEQTQPYKKEFEERNINLFGFATTDSILGSDNPHLVNGLHGLYNIHNIGLPLLISIPYIGGSTISNIFPAELNYNIGVRFIKIFLVLLAGVIVWQSWTISGFFSRNRNVRVFAVIAIVFAYPFIPASNQVYPEILSGSIILLAIIYLIMNEMNKCKPKIWNILLLSFSIAYLPWLQIKFTAPALIVACALSYSYFKTKSSFKYSASLLILLLISIALLAIYNFYAFGKITGPYSTGAMQINTDSFMVLLGLHLDRFQGLFFENVIYFLAIPFAASFYRKNRFVAITIFIIYASIVLPNALHIARYGGGSFAGRFQWAGSIVLIPLTIYSISKMIEIYPRIGWSSVAIAIFINVIMYIKYTFTGFNLYNRADLPALSTYQSFVPFISNMLPAFYDSSWAFKYAINYVWIVIFFFLFSIGIMQNSKNEDSPQVIYSKIGFSLLFGSLVILAINRPAEASFYAASELPSNIGQNYGEFREIGDERFSADFLSYGPYITLPAGDYLATYKYSSNILPNIVIGWVDIVTNCGQTTIANKLVYGTDNILSYVEIPFSLDETKENLEVRFWYDGVGDVSLKSLEIRYDN